jgi:membrane fusion protein (multidrug efflux system)
MKRWLLWTIGGCALLATAGASYWYGTTKSSPAQGSGQSSKQNQGPLVPVKTATAQIKRISETVTVYGTVVASPANLHVISLPYPAMIVHVLVTAGQPVKRGAPLAQVAPSPTTQLKMQQAKTKALAAAHKLKQVKQEYAHHLVVSTQLISAQSAAKTAHQQLMQLEQQGAGKPHTIKSQWTGIVNSVPTQDGQLAAAGMPLLTVADGNQLQAVLGVEPEDIAHIHVGDVIKMTPVHGPSQGAVTGKVHVVSARVDPSSQLINVEASVPPNAGLVLASYIRGTFATRSKKGLVVPRAAVLPVGKKLRLFTVVGGKAQAHMVHAGLTTDTEMEILDSDVQPGDHVVTKGNYELSQGMAVTTGPSQ